MPLALSVGLIVVGVVALVFVLGYLIDRAAGREERHWER